MIIVLGEEVVPTQLILLEGLDLLVGGFQVLWFVIIFSLIITINSFLIMRIRGKTNPHVSLLISCRIGIQQ